MGEDFLESLHFKGFTARVKRLSDLVMYDARSIYQEMAIGIEPNWHLVFLLLKNEERLTVTEIAQRLRFTHPAIIKIIKKMKEKGYVSHEADPNDQRRQFIRLSPKALKELPMLEERWEVIGAAIREIVDEAFLSNLSEVEKKLQEKTIRERVNQKLNSNEK